jgi:hypothetical protein
MDPKNQQQTNTPISKVLKQEQTGFIPSAPRTTQPEIPNRPASVIKTYESDVAISIQQQQESLARMALAEQRRREKEAELRDESVPKQKKIMFAVISGLCILLGIATLIGAYMFLQIKNAPVPLATEPSEILPTDTRVTLDITQNSYDQVVTLLQQQITQTHDAGTIHQIVLQYQAPNEDNATTTYSVTTTEFLQYFLPSIPGNLARAINGMYVLGSNGGASTTPFIILTTSNYESVFGGMLTWEQTMFADFQTIFALPTPVLAPIGFVDSIFQNKDIRILVDENNNPLLIYAFLDRKTLVITTSMQTLQEMYARFIAGQFK